MDRLSKLQKTILIALKEKDEADIEYYKKRSKHFKNKDYLKPPYWNSVRTHYEPGQKFLDKKTDTGISEIVSNLLKKQGESFHASFSRSIRNLVNKGLIEIKYTGDDCVKGSIAYEKYKTIKKQAEYLKLTQEALNVNILLNEVNNKESSRKH